MDNKQGSIPDIGFENRQQKALEFEIVSNREILSKQLKGGHDPFRPHRIQFYAILFILEGNGRHFIDFNSFDYQAGSIIFIAKDQVQRFERNPDRRALFLTFTRAFLEKSSLGSSLMQQLSLYNYHLYQPILQLPDEQIRLFTELTIRLKQEYDAPDDALTEEIILSTLKIFLCLSERIRRQRPSGEKSFRYLKPFQQFEELLQQHLLQNRQVSFYAEKMAISTKKLNRITQEVVQRNAKSYIHDLLVLEMKRLLMNTSLSIKEIAFRTGFEEPTNFVKYFKKFSGMTPREFCKTFD